QPLDRRDAGGRARRRRALQARPDGLRAVEAVEARGAGVAVARRYCGARSSRLAHRMLGHELEASRRAVRHSRRRHRPRLPASRERARADALRLPFRPHGAGLDAQWLFTSRRREDEQEPWEFRYDKTTKRKRLAGRGNSARDAFHSLYSATELDREWLARR